MIKMEWTIQHARTVAYLDCSDALSHFRLYKCSIDKLGVAPSLLRGNPPQVRERLLTHIPIGTPRIDAERHLKSLGLELTPQFELGSEALDSIHCRHNEKKGLFGEATWLIQIDCLDGAVADIFCEQIAIELW